MSRILGGPVSEIATLRPVLPPVDDTPVAHGPSPFLESYFQIKCFGPVAESEVGENLQRV